MNKINFQDAFNMSVLAEAAYYEGIDNNIDHLEGTKWDLEKDGNSEKGLFSYANSTWQVIYHVPNNDTGLQFYLVKNNQTNAYSLAFSGTSAPGGNNPRNTNFNFSDAATDANNALGSIADIYSPFPVQLFDAINHIIKLSTPAGQNYQKLYWNPSSIQNKDLVYSTPSADNTTDYLDRLYIGQSNDVGLGLIPQGTDISLTGQSLGGFLVQALTLIDPANNIEKGYSFNGPGVSEKIVSILQVIKGSVLKPAVIENWYGEAGFEIITPPIAQQGERIGFFAEAGGHDKELLTNALAIASLIQKVAPNLDVDTANTLFYSMHFDEASVLEKSLNDFAKIFNKNWIKFNESDYDTNNLDQRAEFFKRIKEITENTVYKSAVAQGQIYLMNQADILNQMSSKIEIRYALNNLNMFYISGLDYNTHNENMELDVYSVKSETGNMTEQFMRDRAAMIFHMFAGNINNQAELDGDKIVYQLDSFNGKRYLYQDYTKNVDVVIGGGGNALLNPQSKIIFGGSGSDIIDGGISTDHLYGAGGNDTLKGGSGNDYLEGGSGIDHLYGEADNDSLHGGSGDDILDGGAGHDNLLGGADDDTLIGGDGNDYLHGGSGDDKLYGGAGNDILIGAQGAISLAGGGDGNDIIYADQQTGHDDVITGNAGNDIIFAYDGANLISAGEGNDLIYGGSDIDNLNGDEGNDIITGYAGVDDLIGGAGNDLILGGEGDDDLAGGFGTDHLQGGNGIDQYWFANQNLGTDLIRDEDGKGQIVLFGEVLKVAGYNPDGCFWESEDNLYEIRKFTVNDNPDSTTNRTTIMINKKDDHKNTIFIENWQNNGDLGLSFGEEPQFKATEPTTGIQLATDGNNIIYGLNHIQAAGGNDFITSTDGNDKVYAGTGNDIINAGMGDDLIDAGEGNDLIFSGVGRDEIYGGAGNDFIWAAATLNYSKDYVQSFITHDTLESNQLIKNYDGVDYYFTPIYSEEVKSYSYYLSLENNVTPLIFPNIDFGIINDGIKTPFLNISEFNKFENLDTTLQTGQNLGNNTIYGGAGTDFIMGARSSDKIDGGDDNDHLYGNGGNDLLNGGQGNDSIYGGSGRDFINGATGNDQLIGGYESDVIYGGTGNDSIIGDLPNVYGTDAPPESADASRYGDDLIYGDSGNDNILGGGGNDSLYGGNDHDNLVGEEGDDYLFGEQGKDQLYGGTGDDYLFGGTENDYLEGGADHDYLHGGDGDDSLYGQAGDDILNGGTGNDLVFGGAGDDILQGETGVDRIYGGAGHDIIQGGQGNDELVGGAGADSYIFNIGDGKDIITEQQNDIKSLNYNNYILFNFAASANTKVNRVGLDLTIDYGTSDQVTIKDYYKTRNRNNASYLDGYEQYESVEISEIRFEDGTVWNTADILQMAPAPAINEIPPNPLDDAAYFIDALVNREALKVANKSIISYGFPLNDASGKQMYTAEQMLAVQYALYEFGKVLDITFVKATTATADLNFYLDDLTSAEFGAAAGYASPQTGEVHINSILFETPDSLNIGTAGFEVLLHEIGHALGLKHPFEAPVLPEAEDNDNNTVMSYTDNDVNETTLQIFDIAALQYLHGINKNARTEDNSYSMADHYIWDGAGNDTLDASTETLNTYINLAATSWNYVGTKSNSILAQGQSFIGNETLIENAIGGSGDDHLEGNHLNNVLTGGIGHDALFGNLGDDLLLGGEGSDQLIGGQGNDRLEGGQGTDTYTFNVGDGADIIVEEDGNNIIQLNGVVMEDLHYIKGVLYSGWNGGQITVDTTKVATWLINGIAYSTQQLDSVLNATVSSTDHIILDPNAPQRNAQLLGQDNINAQGNALNNVLMGNSGNNILDGAAGNDTLMGGAGDDVYIVDSVNDQVIEKIAEGTDTIQSNVSVANLAENIENLSLTGNAALAGIGNHLNNIIIGNSAANTLDGKFGQDILIGGAGDDLYTVDDVLDITQENANEGTDTVQSSVNFILQDNTENLILTGAAKYGTGNALDNLIIGNDADNILEGGGGHDQIRFGHGHDTLIFKVGSGVVQIIDTMSKAGTDYRTVRFEDLTLQDVDFKENADGELAIKIKSTDDKLIINKQFQLYDQVLIDHFEFSDGTLLSSDIIHLLQYRRPVNGSNQDDVLYGTTSPDFINGGVGNDTIDGGIGNDIIVGGSGNDELDGGGDYDILIGGAGDDVLRPGLGDDTVVFGRGSGHDIVLDSVNDYRFFTNANKCLIQFVGLSLNEVSFYKIDMDLKVVINDTGESILIKDGLVEVLDKYDRIVHNLFQFDDGRVGDQSIRVNVIGTDANDFIRGAYTTDIIRTGLMNDVISLTDGNDEYIYVKNDGNDIIQGIGNVDTLKFVDLSLDDILFTQQSLYDITITIRETGHVIILKNQLNYSMNSTIDRIIFADGSQLTNSQFLDMIRGTDGSEYIYGTNGDDLIEGMAGDDAIYGGEGNNQFKGGIGNDFIIAGNGDDVFDGGDGNDELYGGNGNNTYIYCLNNGSDIISDGKWIDSSFYRTPYWSISNFSTLQMSDIQLSEVQYSFGSDLTLNVFIKSTGEMISIYHQVNQFGEYAIDNFVFNNDVKLSALDMAKSLLSGTDFDDVIYGTIENDVISGGYGNDKLVVLVGQDRLFGGDGNDILENSLTNYNNIGDGHDTLYGDAGDDTLRVYQNDNNILNGGDGNDRIDLYLSDYNIINGGVGDDVIFLTGSSYQTIVFSGAFGNDLIQSRNGSYSYTTKYSLNQKIILENLNVNEVDLKIVNGFDLQITSLIDSNNSITIESQFEYYDKLSQLQFKDGTVYTAEDIKNKFLAGTERNDTIKGFYSNDNIYGLAGDDIIIGGGGQDALVGDEGNDVLQGAGILEGGTGNDKIYITESQSTYVYTLGDGDDIIDTNSINNNIKLQGLIRDQVLFSNNGHDLIITITPTQEKITVYKQLLNDTIPLIRTVYFDDGSSIDYKDFVQNIRTGTAQNDLIYGEIVSQQIFGNAGDDVLFAEQGDDVLDGGTGNDILVGGTGLDTYVFGIGSGHDTIVETSFEQNNTKILVKGLNYTDLAFSYGDNGSNVMSIIATGESIRFVGRVQMQIESGQTYSIGNGVDTLGYNLLDGKLAPDEDHTFYGTNGNDNLMGLNGNDILIAGPGDDILDGGMGNDTLFGGYGRDTYKFYKNAGNDIVVEGVWDNDTVIEGKWVNGIKFEKYQYETIDASTLKYQDIRFQQSATDVLFSINNTHDSIHYTNGNQKRLSTIKLADAIITLQDETHSITGVGNGSIIYGIDNTTSIYGSDGSDQLYSGKYTAKVVGGYGSDIIYGNVGNNTLVGSLYAGNIYYDYDTGADQLFAGKGDDILYGGKGNDILDGGEGVDELNGGYGSDTFVFTKGSGHDFIVDGHAKERLKQQGDVDTLELKNLLINDVSFKRTDYGELEIKINETGENIIIYQQFVTSNSSDDVIINQITFADGKILSANEIYDLAMVQNTDITGFINYGTMLDDDIGALSSYYTTDLLIVYGSDSTSTHFYMNGGLGNDRYYLDGEWDGNKYKSTYKNSTFIFDEDFGNDEIILKYGVPENNTIYFSALNREDVVATRQNNNLLLADNMTGDSVLIRNQYLNNNLLIDQFRFANGQVMSLEELMGAINHHNIQGTDDNDQLYDFLGDDQIYGGQGNDIIISNGGNDQIYGEEGNDTINSNNGNTQIYGGDGNDTITSNNGNHQVYGGAGSDRIISNNGNDQIYGGDGNDSIASNNGNDQIYGDAGNDYLNVSDTSTGSTTLYGGDGDDILYISSKQQGNHVLNGGDGNDELYGGSGDNILIGGKGDDDVYGDSGDDLIIGGEGNDYLFGNGGNNTFEFEGEFGQDRISTYDFYKESTVDNNLVWFKELSLEDVTITRDWYNLYIKSNVSNNRLITDIRTSNDQTLILINKIVFKDGAIIDKNQLLNILSTATDGDNFIIANNENDQIYGYGGNDYLMVTNASGNKILYGGSGNDILRIDNQQLVNQILNGEEGDDGLSGGYGDDILLGGEGDDQLYGNSGDDLLIGGKGNDYLIGGSGNNRYEFEGDFGEDTISKYDYDAITDDNSNSVWFKDLKFADVTITRDRNNIYIRSNVSENILVIETQTFNSNTLIPVNQIIFKDGTIIHQTELLNILPTLGPQDDVIIVGIDDTNVEGGSGSDTFVVAEFNGQSITDSIGNKQDSDFDVLKLTHYDRDDVELFRHGSELEIRAIADQKSLYIINQFYDWSNIASINAIQFKNGQILSQQDIHDNSVILGDMYFMGTYRNDEFISGRGNDSFIFSSGDDKYIFGKDFGKDTISTNNSWEFYGFSTIDLTAFQLEQIAFSREGDALIVTVIDTDDRVFINGQFSAWTDQPIDQFLFGNQTLTNSQIKDLLLTGTDANDYIRDFYSDDILLGGNGDDQLVSLNGTDTLIGGNGNDDLTSFTDANTLIGGQGDDELFIHGLTTIIFDSQSGHDVINSYNKLISIDIVFTDLKAENIKVSEDNGVFIISSLVSDASLTFLVNMDNIRFKFFEGDDFISAVEYLKDQIFTLNGTESNDFLSGESALRQTINAGAGDDIVHGMNNDTVIGGAGNDQLYNYGGNGLLVGDSGNDNLYVFGKNGSLIGGSGNDNLYSADGGNLFIGGAGNDTLYVAGKDNIYQYDHEIGHDTIKVYNSRESNKELGIIKLNQLNKDDIVIVANKHITGIDSNTQDAEYSLALDLIVKDTGETISIESLSDDFSSYEQALNSIPEVSIIFANGQKMSFEGMKENILYSNSNLNDMINGTSGQDFIDGGLGSDILLGGMGDDTYFTDVSTDSIVERYNQGLDHVISQSDYTLSDYVENLTLANDTKALVGIGNNLNNMIKGNENANLLEGHAGNDTLDGGLGADIMQGGVGDDTYLIDDQHDQVIEDVNSGIDLVYSGLSTYTLTANVENLTLTGFENNSGIGNNLDNIILGNERNNQLKGLQGNDTLDGGLGVDTMIGGLGDDIYYVDNILDQVVEEASEGIDTIYSNVTFTASANVENIILVGSHAINATGNALNNSLTGNNASNTLFGGKGQDTLIGGLGNDVYFYTSDSGQDNLIDYNMVNTGEMNTVYFEYGMKREQLILDWDDNDLLVSVAGNSSQLKIQNFKIDQNQWNFVLDNGVTLNKTQIIDYIGKNNLEDYPIVTDDEAILIANQSQVSGNLLGNDHDPAALELSVVNTGVLQGIYGKLNLATDGSYNYIVDPEKVVALKQDQSVTDTFKYTTTNGGFDSNGQLVVNIMGINDVPVASNDGNNILASANQITGNILSNDYDPENDILSIMNFGEQQGLYGVITFAIDGKYTYVVDQGKVAYLNQNQHVKDVFSYQVTDGALDTIGELAIDIVGVNDTPEANLDNAYTVANQNKIVGNVLTNDTDPENTILSVIVPEPIQYGRYGTLQLMGDGNYTYIIDIHKFAVLKEGQITQDAFSYKITDGSLSDIGQLKINLTGVNDAPLLIEDNIALNSDESDTSGNLLYNDSDPESSIIKISNSGIKQGIYGVLHLNEDGHYHYVVDDNADLSALTGEQNVIDTFEYHATDGDLISNSQLIVTINGVNDAPIIVNDFDVVEAKIGEVIGNVLINDLDPENDLLKIINITDQQGLYGVLYLTENGRYHYILDSGALLSIPKDSQVKENFNYFVSDGELIREGSLEIEIINLNHVPVAAIDVIAVQADAIQVTGNVLNNDSDLDADSLTVSNIGDQQGRYGVIHLNTDGSYHYILDANKTKPLKAGQQVVDRFAYEATDDDLSASSELIINITGMNDIPVAATDVIALQADAIQLTGNVLNNDSDLDADSLTVSNSGDQQGRYGVLHLNTDGSYNYILDANKTRPLKAGQQVVDSFAYEATDGDLSASSELIINITGVNDAPVALTSIATQNTYQGVDFSMTIPSNLFKDDDQDDSLLYSVTRTNGAALPNWLYFNTANMSLSGNVPCDINIPLELKVIATDHQGASSHVAFSIQVGRIITGTILPDCLSGSNYNDIIDGCLGIDTMSGGDGDDIYYVDGINLLLTNLTDNVIEEVNQGYDTVNSTVSYTMDPNVEALNLIGNWSISGIGNDLNNLMKGNSADNTLDGGAGDDHLDGGAGTDKLLGGLGNDILNGGTGNDKLIGGVGNDTYLIDSSSDTITENANEGIDTVHSSVTYSLGGNLENLTLIGSNAINGKGNTLANTLKGNSAANMLTGGTGNDTYLFDRASGTDMIVENDKILNNKDILNFASDIAADQLWFVKSGNNLEVSVIGTNNKAVVKDWYLGNAYHVEQLKSGNSLTLLDTEVQNLVQAMAGLTPPPAGQTTLPPDYQTQLHSIISSNWK